MPELTLTIADAKFRLGASVLKIGKYKAYGRVIGFGVTEEGALLYMVEHKAQVSGSFCHHYHGDVLELAAPIRSEHNYDASPYLAAKFGDKAVEHIVGKQAPASLDPVPPYVRTTTGEPVKIDSKTGESGYKPQLSRQIVSGKEPDNSYIEKSKLAAAKARGYTGDACHQCGSFNTVRTGTCLTCADCGSNEGCG